MADFGLARSVACDEASSVEDLVLTEYVATRWYRAPEILLGSKNYSKAVDMWSLGCIMAEMLLGRSLFPGSSTLDQVQLILELLGKPSSEDIEATQNPIAGNIIKTISLVNKKSFAVMFAHVSEDAVNFMKQLLVFNPLKRMTVQEALKHKYM